MIVHINHLAIWAASAIYFVIGGLWYAPFLFGKQWMALNKMTDADRATNFKAYGGMGVLLAVSFAGGVISIYALACIMFVAQIASSGSGMLTGLLVGTAFAFVPAAVSNLFSMRSFRLTLIEAGYVVVALTICGTVLGAWQ